MSNAEQYQVAADTQTNVTNADAAADDDDDDNIIIILILILLTMFMALPSIKKYCES